jgi:hypothetical protein
MEPVVTDFLAKSRSLHLSVEALMSITVPELRKRGQEVIEKMKEEEAHEHVSLWSSSYSALTTIVNRVTPRHRDHGGAPTHLDTLVSAGRHEGAYLEVPDLGLRLKYDPGTVVIIAGRILSHRVPMWAEGERICFAYYMKDNVHEHYRVGRPGWAQLRYFEEMMGPGYQHRQKGFVKGKKRKWED